MPTTDSIGQYLAMISRYDLLTPAEERSLLMAVAQGDQRAEEKLLKHNLRLVVHIAKKYRRASGTLDFLDLVQEGAIGLRTAIRKFDLKHGKLSTYAYCWIKQAMTRAIGNSGYMVRVPIYKHEEVQTIKKNFRQLTMQLGREPELKEVAAAIGKPCDWIVDRLESLQTVKSLDQKIGGSHNSQGDESTLGDLLGVEGEQWQLLMVEEERAKVEHLLSGIPQRYAAVLRLRYGLDNGTPRTLEQVGKLLGRSKEAIRQIESKALRQLRNEARAATTHVTKTAITHVEQNMTRVEKNHDILQTLKNKEQRLRSTADKMLLQIDELHRQHQRLIAEANAIQRVIDQQERAIEAAEVTPIALAVKNGQRQLAEVA